MGKRDCKRIIINFMEEAYRELHKKFADRLKRDEILAPYTTFKIGGPADLFYIATNKEELVSIITESRKLQIPMFILGGGSNILIGDKGIRGIVIKNNMRDIHIVGMKGKLTNGTKQGQVYVESESGVLFNSLVRFAIEQGLGGIEEHLGLPGTVGGAIFMNSKWTHPETFVGDVVYQATILTPKNQIIAVPQSYFRFGYDKSSIQKSGDIVLSVVFGLMRENKEHLWEIANKSIAYRRQTQPQGVFTPGCTFQNITRAQALAAATPGHTMSAGFLIDHAGLKGVSVGDAQISTSHANFIINHGKASASDVLQLIEKAREQVKKLFGVDIKEEIIRVGEF